MPKNEKSTEDVQVEQSPNLEETVIVDDETLKEVKDNVQNDLVGKGKKKKWIVGVVAAVIAIILVIGGIGYKVISNNPTNILKDSINNAYKDFKDELKEYDKKKKDFDITKDSLKINGDIELTGDMFKDIKDDKISFTAGFDYANKLLEGEATLKEDGKDLLNATVFTKDNKMYLKSNNLFDNTYELDDFDFDSEFNLEELEEAMKEVNNVSTDDIDYLVKEFKDALIKSLNKDEMTKEKEEIEINDLSVKTTKISYNIDKSSTKELMTSLSDILTENDEFLSKLAKLTDTEKSDIKDALKELKDSDNYEDMPKGELNVYTTGVTNKVVKVELKLDTVTVSYSDYKDNIYLLVSEKQSDMKLEVIAKTEKKVTDVEVKFNKQKIATLTVRQFDEEGIDLDYDINVEDEIKAKGTIKITCKEKSSTEYEGVMEFSINAEIDGEEIDFGVKMNYTIKTKEKIADYDTSKAIESDDITEEDSKKLESALEDLENSKIYSFIEDMDLDDLLDMNTGNNSSSNIKDLSSHKLNDDIYINNDDGKYRLKITGIKESKQRNEYSDKEAKKVIVISYEYENLTLEDDLYISSTNFKAYDNDNNSLETYEVIDYKYPNKVSNGRKATAEMVFALNNDSNYIELEFYDNPYNSKSNTKIALEW